MKIVVIAFLVNAMAALPIINPLVPPLATLEKDSFLLRKIKQFTSIFKPKMNTITIDGTSYVPIQKLGKGGFGRVVEARNLQDPTKIVAIKTFFKNKKHSKESFDQEVAALKHFGKWIASDRKKLMIVMDKVPGKSLDTVINGKMSQSEIKKLQTLYLETIRGFHAQGWIHGDIRPGNVMYHNGKMELIDFGNSLKNTGTEADKAHKFFLDELQGREAFDQFVYLTIEKHLQLEKAKAMAHPWSPESRNAIQEWIRFKKDHHAPEVEIQNALKAFERRQGAHAPPRTS